MVQYLHFRILEFPLIMDRWSNGYHMTFSTSTWNWQPLCKQTASVWIRRRARRNSNVSYKFHHVAKMHARSKDPKCNKFHMWIRNPSILFNPFGGINVTTSHFGVHHRSSSRAQIPFMTRQASDWETDGTSSWYLCSGSTVGLSCLWVINCHGKLTLSHKAMQRALFSQHISAGWPGWM